MRFEDPHEGLCDSYRELVADFRKAGEPLIPFPLTFPNADFPAFLARLAACQRGAGISKGFVAHSTYWLVCDDVVVGVVNLRHSLTDALRRLGGSIGYGVRPSARGRGFAHALLRGALSRAAAMGMLEVLLTCDEANMASIRTIVGNGGVLVSHEFLPEHGEVVRRYRIALKP